MILVKKENYKRFIPLFEEVNWELSGMAVLSGNNPGKLFADSEDKPTVALMITPEGILIVGDTDNRIFNKEIKKWFDTDYIPEGIKKDYDEFTFYCSHKWEKQMKLNFEFREPIRDNRYHYINNLQSDYKYKIPDGFEFREITQEMIEEFSDSDFVNHIKGWIDNNWGGYENYNQNGFGFCITKGKEIISWSLSDCEFDNKCEIGIHTNPAYRKQGFAYQTVQRMLNFAKENGYEEVGWHCAAENTGSYKTAEKGGFLKTHEYSSFYGFFNETDHIVFLGLDILNDSGNLEKAETLFKKGEESGEMKNFLFFRIAVNLSQKGYFSRSFSYLRKAIKEGFNHKKFILDSNYLENLHDQSEWKEIEMLLE